jgi:hypothetical protein
MEHVDQLAAHAPDDHRERGEKALVEKRLAGVDAC